MKYLVVTTPIDTDPGDVSAMQKAIGDLMPGVKAIVIVGATSAVLVETDGPTAIVTQVGDDPNRTRADTWS